MRYSGTGGFGGCIILIIIEYRNESGRVGALGYRGYWVFFLFVDVSFLGRVMFFKKDLEKYGYK